MTREEIDKVIESAEAGKTEYQRDGLLMNDNEDYMALLSLAKQLREEGKLRLHPPGMGEGGGLSA